MQRRSLLQSLLAGVSGALLSTPATARSGPPTPTPTPTPTPGPLPAAVFVPDPTHAPDIAWWSGVAGSFIRSHLRGPGWGFVLGDHPDGDRIPARQVVLRRADGWIHSTPGWLHLLGREAAPNRYRSPESLGMDPDVPPDVDLEA